MVDQNAHSTVFFHIPAVHGKAAKSANVNTGSVRRCISFNVSVFQRHITQNKQAAATVEFICPVRICSSASTADNAVFHFARIINRKLRSLLHIDDAARKTPDRMPRQIKRYRNAFRYLHTLYAVCQHRNHCVFCLTVFLPCHRQHVDGFLHASINLAAKLRHNIPIPECIRTILTIL